MTIGIIYINPKFGIKILQILQGQFVGLHFLIFLSENLQGTSYFEFQKVFVSKDLAPNTMLTQYHYKHYELDLQKIVKYALDYHGCCLKTSFIIS